MFAKIAVAWIAGDVRNAMVTEAERAFPDETGGVLLGYWTASHDEVVVTDMVGPGPHAIHRPYSFVPDAHYHEHEIARLYEAANRRITYLGDWHTHPHGPAYLSRQDCRTLRRISNYREARAPEPLMAVLARGIRWRMGLWALKPPRTMGSTRFRRIVPLPITVF